MEAIQTDRANRKAASDKGNHERWHVGEGKRPSGSCPFCFPKQDAKSDPKVEGEPEGEPEGEGNPPRPPVNYKSVATERTDLIVADFMRIALQGMTERGEIVKSETGLRRYLTEQARQNPNLTKWASMFPTAPTDAVAGWLHGDKGSMRYYPRADEIAETDHADVIQLHRREPA